MLRLDEVKGGFRSPIFCTLEEVDLELQLQFLALSYVWDSMADSHHNEITMLGI
jgi:hypothetical protein